MGSIFGSAPGNLEKQLNLEAKLLDNERQMEVLGSAELALDVELECLCAVLEHPERYICVEPKQLRLSTMPGVSEGLRFS